MSEYGHNHEILDVVGLEEALASLEPAVVPTTITDYYAGDKTFQPLNKTSVNLNNVDNTADTDKPVSAPQAIEFNKKLEDLDSPATGGVLLNMPKEGVLGRLKKLLVEQDVTLTDNIDTISIGVTGRTLKDFTESSYAANAGKFYRELIPNLPTGADAGKAVNLRLGGRINAGILYSVAFTDSSSTYGNINTGLGSVDLQINRTNINQTASGNNNFVSGQTNQVSASNAIVLAANTATNIISGTGSTVLIGGSATAATVNGASNLVIAGGGTYSGSGNVVVGQPGVDNGVPGNGNILIGSGHGITGNGSVAIRAGGSSLNPANSRGMSNIFLKSTVSHSSVLYNIQQNVSNYYKYNNSSASAVSGTWYTATSNLLAAGTTNVYNTYGSCGFEGFMVTNQTTAGANIKVFHVVGGFANSLVSFTATLVAGSVDPTLGEVQVVVSGSYLLFQGRHLTGANSDFQVAANINFYEM